MVRITRMTKKRLGELLKDEGLLTDAQITEALGEQRKSGELLGEVLVRLEYVTEEDIAKTIVAQFGLPYIDVGQYFVPDEVIGLFSPEMMQKYQFFPLDRIGGVVTIAVGGLLNFDVLAELEGKTGCRIQVYVSTWSSVRQAIEKQLEGTAAAVHTEANALDSEAGAPAASIPEAGDAEAEPDAAAVDGASGEGGEEEDELGMSELGSLLLGEADGGGKE